MNVYFMTLDFLRLLHGHLFFERDRRLHTQPKFCCPKSSPRSGTCAHKFWKSRPPERLPSSGSSARVKGGNHVFGECRWRHDYSHHPLLPGGDARHRVDRHCNTPARHRAGRLLRQALCQLAQPALVPLGIMLYSSFQQGLVLDFCWLALST